MMNTGVSATIERSEKELLAQLAQLQDAKVAAQAAFDKTLAGQRIAEKKAEKLAEIAHRRAKIESLMKDAAKPKIDAVKAAIGAWNDEADEWVNQGESLLNRRVGITRDSQRLGEQINNEFWKIKVTGLFPTDDQLLSWYRGLLDDAFGTGTDFKDGGSIAGWRLAPYGSSKSKGDLLKMLSSEIIRRKAVNAPLVGKGEIE